MSEHIPFFSFAYMHGQIQEEIVSKFHEVYDSNAFIMGNQLRQFESAYAGFCKTAHSVGVSNGLDALHIALKVLDIKAGDEVIVPANTYFASWLAVSLAGATPVPVEPDIVTYNIDPSKIRGAITINTKAILPVHLFGQACEMDAIMKIAKEFQLYIVEDNAQAQGAAYKGIPTGSFGDINAHSFYPTKNFGALGDAGAITTQNPAYKNQVEVFRNYGSPEKNVFTDFGFNARMDEMQAAFLLVKLKYLPSWNLERQQIAAQYNQALQGIGDLILPSAASGATHIYHLYVVRTAQREALKNFLAQQVIDTLVHYPVPPHLQEAYKQLNFKAGEFPITETLAATSLSLPLWPGLKKDKIEIIINCIKKFYS